MATYKKIKRDKAVFISCWTPFYIQLALTKIFPHLVINEHAYQFISCYGFISRLKKGSKKNSENFQKYSKCFRVNSENFVILDFNP